MLFSVDILHVCEKPSSRYIVTKKFNFVSPFNQTITDTEIKITLYLPSCIAWHLSGKYGHHLIMAPLGYQPKGLLKFILT